MTIKHIFYKQMRFVYRKWMKNIDPLLLMDNYSKLVFDKNARLKGLHSKYQRMSIDELQNELKKNNLNISGSKNELVNRLYRMPNKYYWYLFLQLPQTVFYFMFVVSYYQLEQNLYSTVITLCLYILFLIVNLFTFANNGWYRSRLYDTDLHKVVTTVVEYEYKEGCAWIYFKLIFYLWLIIFHIFSIVSGEGLINNYIIYYSFIFLYLYEFLIFGPGYGAMDPNE